MSDENEFIEVYLTHKASDIAFIKSIMDANDIRYFIDGENFVQTHGFAVPAKVRVESNQVEIKALKLV